MSSGTASGSSFEVDEYGEVGVRGSGGVGGGNGAGVGVGVGVGVGGGVHTARANRSQNGDAKQSNHVTKLG